MKYMTEYRDAKLVNGIINEIRHMITHRWVIMEICGGQTHSIMQYGLDQLLPPEIELVHGPGCPVCVTSLEMVDKALQIASLPDTIFTSYGDMLRVPGSSMDLFTIRAKGGDVRIVYSPLDAVKIALQNPEKQVVFFAIGFETTAPANAMSVLQAETLGLTNFSILVSQVRVPPAIKAILGAQNNRVQGFLAAGHVCTVMGYWEYFPIAEQFHIPIVVTGFEPLDLVHGIFKLVSMLEGNQTGVGNAYSRIVTPEGNQPSQTVIHQVFEDCDQKWRGIGVIPGSGWRLQEKFKGFDAEQRFQVDNIHPNESPLCIAGQILQGMKKPFECAAFAVQCTPENPLGATMVSSEGACSAYYKYARPEVLVS